MRDAKEVKYTQGRHYTEAEFNRMTLFERTKLRRADPEQYEKLQRDEMRVAYSKTADPCNSFREWEKKRKEKNRV